MPTFLVAEEKAEPPPVDPKYLSEHLFVVVNGESDLFASYIPEFRDPQNQQLVYLVDAKGPTLFYLVRDADKVTVKTKAFNLEHLIRGETIQTTLDVYIGDYDQAKQPTYVDVPVNFARQLYYRPLGDLEPSSVKQVYDIIDFDAKQRIFVHRLTHPPTYDHLVLVEEPKSCVTQFFTTDPAPAESELLRKLLFCGSLKPLYFNRDNY